LPDSSSEDHIVLVEFWGGLKRNRQASKRWDECRQSTYPVVGAKTLWYGRCDHHVFGTAVPAIEDVRATWFPDATALAQALSAPQRDEHLQSLRPYLAYTASSMSVFLPKSR
jgi:hypothetical protein